MPGKSPGPSIKNPAVYEALRKKGYSKEKAARISNAMGDSTSVELEEMLTLDADGFRLTSDGYLVTEPRVARTGIQLYKGYEVGRPDMEDVRVYRPEEEVFSHAAMATLAHRTITLDHPFTKVDSSNWKEHAVGHSSEPVARDGDFLRVPLVLMDAHAISAAQSGTSQLSVGYAAKLKWEPGKAPDGQLYDAMQTEIRANHIALVSKARGGDKLKIGDDDDGDCEDGDDEAIDREFSTTERQKLAKTGAAMPHGGFPIKSEGDLKNAIRAIGRAKNPGAAKAHIKKRASALGLSKLIPSTWGDSEGDTISQKRRSVMTERTLNLDGVNIALEDKDGQILERHLKTLNDSAADLRKQLSDAAAEATKFTGQIAELSKTVGIRDGEIVVLKKQIEDSKLTDAEIDRRCRERIDIVERAGRFLGDAFSFNENKSNAQIRREVAVTHLGETMVKDLDDARIEGVFLSLTQQGQKDGFRNMVRSFSQAPVNTGVNDAAAKAYDKRNQDLANAWKRKGATA
jgi:hypothetical protein